MAMVVLMHLVQKGVFVGQSGVGFTLDVQLGGGSEERGELGEGFGFDHT